MDKEEEEEEERLRRVNVFRYSWCIVCASDGDPLRACSRCLVARYCSVKCQRAHWPNHKRTCKRLGAVARKRFFDAPGDPSLASTSLSVRGRAWNAAIDDRCGPTDPVRVIMASLPKCHLCLAGAGLQECPQCRLAWYCETHATAGMLDHMVSGRCALLTSGRVLWQHMMRGLPPVMLSRNVGPTCAPPTSWADYWAEKPLKEELPEGRVSAALEHIAQRITEHSLTVPMTTVFGLHKLAVPVGEHLCVHVVGADMALIAEVDMEWEEVMHWFPQCKEFTVVFVGPDLIVRNVSRGEPTTVPMKCCPSCESLGRKRTHVFAQGLWYELHGQLPRAHLILAFNCGVHDNLFYGDRWLHTLRQLNAPALFTSYTDGERGLDEAVIAANGGTVLFSERNPFASPLARDDPSLIEGTFQYNHSCTGFVVDSN